MYVSDVPSGDPPGPEPSLAVLEARVAELCGTINVVTAELVDTIAAVEASGKWAAGGFRTVQHWVQVHTGVSARRAKDLVELARRLDDLPETMDRFRAGSLSEDQVVPIARHVPAAAEASVAELASHATAAQVRRVCTEYRFPKPADPTDPNKARKDVEDDDQRDDREARDRRRRQSVSFGWDDEEFWRLAARLTQADGALAQKALEAARDELFNERRAANAADEEPQVTWCDAFVRLCEHGLAHMEDGKGSRTADRQMVILHKRVEDLDANSDPAAHLHLGPSVSSKLADYLSCDCSVRVLLEKDGKPVNLGRKYRTVPDRLRRVVEDRDKGCRFPGCGCVRWLDIHHITHWGRGGATDTCNLCGFCKYHHRLHHNGEFTVEGNADDPNGLVFRDKWGRIIPTGPRPKPPDPAKPRPPGRWIRPSGEPLRRKWISWPDGEP